MPNGFTGTILRVDLSSGKTEQLKLDENFYRMYMGGSAIGTYFLLKETDPDTNPLSKGNIITIAPGVTTAAPVSGVSRFCVTALSPETNAVGDSQAGGNFGPYLKRAGFDAIIITGKAEKISYLLIDDNNNVQIIDASNLKGKTVLDVHDILTDEYGKKNVSILQCGPAGEKLVRFACLLADLNDVAGRTGMGAVFGSKNLRAVVIRTSGKVSFADPDGLKKLAREAKEKLPNADFPSVLKKYGTPGVVGFQAQSGNLSTHNYSRSFHEDYKKLDGENYEQNIGAGQTTCFGCIVSCRKKVKCQQPYEVTDRLGGPEFETLGLLGTNLDITDPVAVAKANELCNNYGIDTITMGGLAAYLFESIENDLISRDLLEEQTLTFGNADGLLWLIEKVAHRKGIGDILAEGFATAVDKLGAETKKYAISVKNHGLAAHMAQVKPSQALMYAVCPIGADHMSCEHDWLLASGAEVCKSLGVLEKEKADSTSFNKVRITVYSQYFYSLLDTLCLCMFCWGPGNLFSYRQLEDLVKSATGWDCTFWEIMKVGERRINMMRQLNAKRGFSRKDDRLPERLFEPLPDGPAKEKCVDMETFEHMQDLYYGMMGWDVTSGNPETAKLVELGLEWTILSPRRKE